MTSMADSQMPALFERADMLEHEASSSPAEYMASIDANLKALEASMRDVTSKVHILEERSQSGIDERKDMQKSLNALNASVNQMIGKLGINTRKPWYAEPSFHLALLAAVLLLIIGARELGTENTGKLIDHFLSVTIQ